MRSLINVASAVRSIATDHLASGVIWRKSIDCTPLKRRGHTCDRSLTRTIAIQPVMSERVVIRTGSVARVADGEIWQAYLCFLAADQAVAIKRDPQTILEFLSAHHALYESMDRRLSEVLRG